ncbi:MAG: hypothetical protein ACK5Z4_09820, partial [Planctomyces sp.]
FCCEPCHARYMAEQRKKWNAPATGVNQPERVGYFSPSTEARAWSLSRPGRPDPCWDTDEQVGLWSVCVRALEEATC